MSFDISNSSYNSYLNNNTSFSKSKIEKMETFANKTLEDVKSEAATTIRKNGKTYYVVKVDGESYLYDYANDSYTKFKQDGNSTKETTYNAQSDSVSVADSEGKRRENFSYNASNNKFSFLTATKDNNIFAKNTTVIDDFLTIDNDITIGDKTPFTHGEIVSAILEAGGSKVTRKNVGEKNLASGNTYLDIQETTNYLDEVIKDAKNGKDIDSVNLSIEVSVLAEFLGDDVKELSSNNIDNLYEKLKSNTSAANIITLIDKIKEAAEEGISVHIAAGNSADDAIGTFEGYGYDAGKTYTDQDKNGKIEGRDYGVFNLLTLAAGKDNKNVHIIGSSNDNNTKAATLENSANYSNYNNIVDKLFDGSIEFTYISSNGNGTHKFYIEDIGYCNLELSDSELAELKKNNNSFTATGTSFATPKSIAKGDTSLT